MLDDAAIFLRHAGKKPRNIDKRQNWNLKTVAEADEARRFLGGIDV